MKKILCKNQKAFTIIETLVAIFILSLSITGPLFYVSNTFQLARISKYKMTAYFLATETLEEIKYKRDITLGTPTVGEVDDDDWIEDIESSSGGSDYFDWDKDSSRFIACPFSPTNPCGGLGINVDDGYIYDGGYSPSPFYRYAEIIETGSPSERKIIVTVGWDDGIITGDLQVTEYIYDFNA